ncbi:response regulator [Paenibacillus sp. y28]|uniref:response regulator n=1 Tax=Paenibacillus sp. y28 TaxID=3129110 RepID=UPI003016E897
MNDEVTMCVIDDIRSVVNGIVNHIPWGEHGIRIVGTAYNGEEGLQMIRSVKPDIVLTDIRMPKVDGLDMMRLMQAESPKTKVIFMSGYTEFNYAQQAIRLGAFDYILKPFTPNQVLEIVLKAKQVLMEDLHLALRMNEMEHKVRESIPVLRQEYFRLLLRYKASPKSARERWDFLQVGIDKENFIVLLAEIDQLADQSPALPVPEVELLRFAAQNIMEETISRYTNGLVFREDIQRLVAVINPTERISAEALAEECRENIARYSSCTVSIGIGTEVRDIPDISDSYQQAIVALSYNFYTGGNSVYSYSDVTPAHPMPVRQSAEKERELFYCLRSGNMAKAEKVLDDIFEEDFTFSVPPEPGVIRNNYYELAFLIHRIFMEKLTDEERQPLEQRLKDIKAGTALTLKDTQELVRSLCREGCELLRGQQTKEAHQLINQVTAYMKDNLHLNMTANDYARIVFLSGSYFSNLFKKVTGMTIHQYVTSARMEKAKDMLIEGRQVQEISLALGYEDRPYFTELFKRHTGMTPSEFRQLYASDSSQ